VGEGAIIMTQITISNAGGTLSCDAIAYSERQKCDVAIRDIPTRSTGSLIDTGTWTLKNRVLTMTIRFTDAGKSTLQGIFDQSAKVTIAMAVEGIGFWVYTGWLRKKPIVYEYSKDETNTKEWRAKLEFVISSFQFDVINNPSTVATTDKTMLSFQLRKVWYANGRYWVFWVKADRYVYFASSADAITWDSPTQTSMSPVYDGRNLSTWASGNYIHTLRTESVWSQVGPMYYRRGLLNADGTISWDSDVQPHPVNCWYMHNICVDSSGYPCILYNEVAAVNNNLYVRLATNVDGSTWGAGTILKILPDVSQAKLLIPLSSGRKLLAIYCILEQYTAYSRFYDGVSAWAAETTVATGLAFFFYWNGVIDSNDNVHFAHIGSGSVKHTVWTESGGWGSVTTIFSGMSGNTQIYLTVGSNGEIFLFWMASNHIYLRMYLGGNWSGAIDVADESTDGITSNIVIVTYWSGKIGIVYLTKSAAPYNIRHLVIGEQ